MIEIDSPFLDGIKAEGKAEGALAAERQLCLEMAAKHHPTLLDAVRPLIEASEDASALKRWMLCAADLDDEAFGDLVGIRKPR